MNASELSRVIEAISRDQGISKEVIIQAIEEAYLASAQKKYEPGAVLETRYNRETGEIDLYRFKKVVERKTAENEIPIDEARTLDPQTQIGDELGVVIEKPDFGRIDAAIARQTIFRKVREAEHEVIVREYSPRVGEVISGIVRRFERGDYVVDLGKGFAYLPRSETLPHESFKPGDRVEAYLKDVAADSRGPRILLTRTSPMYAAKLLETVVPELRDGTVEIKACVREAGSRTKIAVISKDRFIDPVAVCVGPRGTRVQQVVNELAGERVDVIQWSDDVETLIKAALQPAQLLLIEKDPARRSMEVVLEDDQLPKALGRRGANVRLAQALTGPDPTGQWKLTLLSKTDYQKRTREIVTLLQQIEGVNEITARLIYNAGYKSVEQVAEAPIDALQKIPGYESDENAFELKTRAQEAAARKGPVPTAA